MLNILLDRKYMENILQLALNNILENKTRNDLILNLNINQQSKKFMHERQFFLYYKFRA